MANLFQTTAGSSTATVPSTSYDIINLGLATSVGSNALTIALKQSDGSTDPASGSGAVKIAFRSTTATSGSYIQRSCTSATSIVISSGSTLGQASGLISRLYIYAIDNAGTIELAVSGVLYSENKTYNTNAEGGGGGADNGAAIYSTTIRSGIAIRLIGYLDNTQATAGTWASAGTVLAVGTWSKLTDEKPFAQARRTSNQTIANGVTAVFDAPTVDMDSHSSVTTGASWKFTAPISGTYKVSTLIYSNDGTTYFATGNGFNVYASKNGGTSILIGGWNAESTTAAEYSLAFGDLMFQLLAGEYCQVSVQNTDTSSHTFIGNIKVVYETGYNY